MFLLLRQLSFCLFQTHSQKVIQMQGFNKTTVVTQFILVGFSSLGELQLLLFVIFLLLNLTILVANVTIMAVIHFSWTLHTPMYDFLLILSFSESCYTFVIITQLLVHLLLDTKTITFMACANQLFFFLAFASTNCFLIAVMGYDRYVAICHSLRYTLIMNRRLGLVLILSQEPQVSFLLWWPPTSFVTCLFVAPTGLTTISVTWHLLSSQLALTPM